MGSVIYYTLYTYMYACMYIYTVAIYYYLLLFTCYRTIREPLVVCSTLLFQFPGVSYWYTCVLLIYSHLLLPLHMQYLMQCPVLTVLLSSRLWLPSLWHCSQYSSFLLLLYSLPSCFTQVSQCIKDYCIDSECVSARAMLKCTQGCALVQIGTTHSWDLCPSRGYVLTPLMSLFTRQFVSAYFSSEHAYQEPATLFYTHESLQ